METDLGFKSVIPEPVPKDIQKKYVQAAQDLQWLADRGYLIVAAGALKVIRSLYEDEEKNEHPAKLPGKSATPRV